MRSRTHPLARPAGAFAAAAAIVVLSGPAVLPRAASPAPQAEANASRLCTKVVVPPWRADHYLLVVGTADSVRAGPGTMQVWQSPDGTEPGPVPEDAVIRGQRVRVVDAIGFDDRLTRLMAERGAVLVPWDYGGICWPMVWTRSPILAGPGARKLVPVHPRAEAHWADGVPTFDFTDPYQWPYPRPGWIGLQSRGGEPLGAEQLLAFIRVQPVRGEVEARGPAAFEAALEWADAHPDLAARPPVANALPYIRRAHMER